MNILVGLDDRASRKLREIDRAAQSLSTTLRTAGVAAAAFAGGAIVSGITKQYLAYEKYRTVLTTFLGSQQKANAELDRLKSLAVALPQDLQDVTQAFTILTRNGIDTSNKSLTAFSNIATANGKSLTQLGEAIADALTGEFERLKEFGIKVSKENGKFVARIGDQQVALAGTTTELVSQLQALGAEGGRFGGAAAANAGTLGQAFSNLSGTVYDLKISVMDQLAPAFIEATNVFNDFIKANEKLIVLTAKDIGAGLKEAIPALAAGLKTISDNIGPILTGLKAFAAFKIISIVAPAALELGSALATVGRAALMLGPLLVTPMGLAVVAITAAAAALYYFRDTSIMIGGKITTLGKLTTDAFNKIKEVSIGLWDDFTNGISNAITKIDEFATNNGIYDFATKALASVKEFTVNAVAAIMTYAQFTIRTWELIGSVFGAVVNNIYNNWDNITTYVKDAVRGLIDPIIAFGQGVAQVFNDTTATASGLWDDLVNAIGNALRQFGSRVKKMLNFVINTFVYAFQVIKAIIFNLPKFFVEAIKGVGQVMAAFASSIVQKFSNIWEAIKLAGSGSFTDAWKKANEEVAFDFGKTWETAMADVEILPRGAVDAAAIYAEDRIGQAVETFGTYLGTIGGKIGDTFTSIGDGAVGLLDKAISGATGGAFTFESLKESASASFAQITADFANNKAAIQNAINGISFGPVFTNAASEFDKVFGSGGLDLISRWTAEMERARTAVVNTGPAFEQVGRGSSMFAQGVAAAAPQLSMFQTMLNSTNSTLSANAAEVSALDAVIRQALSAFQAGTINAQQFAGVIAQVGNAASTAGVQLSTMQSVAANAISTGIAAAEAAKTNAEALAYVEANAASLGLSGEALKQTQLALGKTFPVASAGAAAQVKVIETVDSTYKKAIESIDEFNLKQANTSGAMKMLEADFVAGKISMEEFKEAMNSIGGNMDMITDKSLKMGMTFTEKLTSAIDGLSSSISGTLTDVFMGVKSGFEGMKDIAVSVISTIVNALIENFIVAPLLKNINSALSAAFTPSAGIGGLFGGGGGGLFGFLGGLFGFAEGGSTAKAGQKPILVGEKGPEIFYPGKTGAVIPNDKLGGGNSEPLQVVFNINAIDTQTGTEFLMKNKAMIVGAVQESYAKRGRPGPLG